MDVITCAIFGDCRLRAVGVARTRTITLRYSPAVRATDTEFSDVHLLEIACRPYHCLYHLLPPERHVGYDLRNRGHSHELIAH